MPSLFTWLPAPPIQVLRLGGRFRCASSPCGPADLCPLPPLLLPLLRLPFPHVPLAYSLLLLALPFVLVDTDFLNSYISSCFFLLSMAGPFYSHSLTHISPAHPVFFSSFLVFSSSSFSLFYLSVLLSPVLRFSFLLYS